MALTPNVPAWEYKIVELAEKRERGSDTVPWNNLASVQETITKLGNECWELVSAMPRANEYGATYSVLLWFKRPGREHSS